MVRHVDFRDFLDADPAEVRYLRLETPSYRHTARYGARGGVLLHTVHRHGSEWMFVEDQLEPGVTHFVKLLREEGDEWMAYDVGRLHDRTAELVNLW